MSERILILDDEIKFAQMLSDLVAENGYQADITHDPQEALQRLRKRAYKLIVADYKMPVMNGAQFLAEIRKGHPNLPVIMVSGVMSTPELLKVANLGVTLVLEKPFDTQVFLQYVQRFVEPEEDEMEELPGAEGAPGDKAKSSPGHSQAYPHPALYVADSSKEAQGFMQRLWQRRYSRRMALMLHEGGELEPILAEILHWEGQADCKPLRISLDELVINNQHALVQSGIDSEAPLILVDGREEPVGDCLERAARLLEDDDVGPDEPVVVIAMTDPGIRLHEYSLPEGLIRVPALCERPQDIARYIISHLEKSRLLNPGEGAWLDEDAIRLALCYPWPGDYNELHTAIRRVQILAKQSPVSLEILQKALSHRFGDEAPSLASCSAEYYLRNQQARYLQNHYESSLADTLQKVQAPDTPIREGARIDDLPLLFPELLEAATHLA